MLPMFTVTALHTDCILPSPPVKHFSCWASLGTEVTATVCSYSTLLWMSLRLPNQTNSTRTLFTIQSWAEWDNRTLNKNAEVHEVVCATAQVPCLGPARKWPPTLPSVRQTQLSAESVSSPGETGMDTFWHSLWNEDSGLKKLDCILRRNLNPTPILFPHKYNKMSTKRKSTRGRWGKSNLTKPEENMGGFFCFVLFSP